MNIRATENEALMLIRNASSQACMLSIVIAMLCHRVGSRLTLISDKEAFDQKLTLVGTALGSFQNCLEKPPLSNGEQLIKDQLEVIKLPQTVENLFIDSGYDPIIELVYNKSHSSVLTSGHHFSNSKVKLGITFKFSCES